MKVRDVLATLHYKKGMVAPLSGTILLFLVRNKETE